MHCVSTTIHSVSTAPHCISIALHCGSTTTLFVSTLHYSGMVLHNINLALHHSVLALHKSCTGTQNNALHTKLMHESTITVDEAYTVVSIVLQFRHFMNLSLIINQIYTIDHSTTRYMAHSSYLSPTLQGIWHTHHN